MPTYTVKWAVKEHVNGPGQHDDGVRDGDIRVLANAEVDREAESAEELRSELTAFLEQHFPRLALGPTYNLDRVYEIEITEARLP